MVSRVGENLAKVRGLELQAWQEVVSSPGCAGQSPMLVPLCSKPYSAKDWQRDCAMASLLRVTGV